MWRMGLVLAFGVLAACGLRDPRPAPLLSIADGSYAAALGGSCLTLDFGRRDRQTLLQDSDCDGVAEARSDFAVTDNLIQTDVGTMTVTAVGASSFSGAWTAGGSTTEVRFDRVES